VNEAAFQTKWKEAYEAGKKAALRGE